MMNNSKSLFVIVCPESMAMRGRRGYLRGLFLTLNLFLNRVFGMLSGAQFSLFLCKHSLML